MPAPHQCTLPTPYDRGCGPMRTCGLCRGNVHGGVVQVRAGFVLGRGWGAPLSKVRLWAHARRGRRETLDVHPQEDDHRLGLPERNWRWTCTVC